MDVIDIVQLDLFCPELAISVVKMPIGKVLYLHVGFYLYLMDLLVINLIV